MEDSSKQENVTWMQTKDIMKMFGVTIMTVNNWRKGSPSITKLPTEARSVVINGKRSSVSFDQEKVLQWAKENGIKAVKK